MLDSRTDELIEYQNDLPGTDEYLVTRDIANHAGVKPATVYYWIKRGIISAKDDEPKNPQPGKRKTHRYKYPLSVIDRINEVEAMLHSSGQLRRYVFRHMGIQGGNKEY